MPHIHLTIRATRTCGKGRKAWSKAERIAATLRRSPREVPGDFSLPCHAQPRRHRAGSPPVPEGQLSAEDSLIEVGVIDSTGVLELIGFIEERYEVQIADEEVLPENLDSIASITRFVGEKNAASNGAG